MNKIKKGVTTLRNIFSPNRAAADSHTQTVHGQLRLDQHTATGQKNPATNRKLDWYEATHRTD